MVASVPIETVDKKGWLASYYPEVPETAKSAGWKVEERLNAILSWWGKRLEGWIRSRLHIIPIHGSTRVLQNISFIVSYSGTQSTHLQYSGITEGVMEGYGIRSHTE